MLRNIFNFDLSSKDTVKDQWRAHFKNRARPNARPNMEFKAAADGAPAQIFIYDEISYWGITAADFQRQLMLISADAIDVHINSPGGDVFDGTAIYNALKSNPAKITCYVDGLAASIASLIAMAGDEIVMADASMMMIHKAWGLTIGNDDDHLSQAIVLGKIDDMLASVYAAKTGMTPEECKAIMTAETWLTAAEAMDKKLCTSIANALVGTGGAGDAPKAEIVRADAAPAEAAGAPSATEGAEGAAEAENAPTAAAGPADDEAEADQGPTEAEIAAAAAQRHRMEMRLAIAARG